jgi:hypothetical protein
MNKILFLWKIGLSFLLISCGQDLIESGAIGGACRLTPAPCDADLICIAGKCAANTSQTPPNLSMVAELSARSLVANGEDEIEIQILINLEDSDTPFNGQLLLYTEPSGVGTLSANLLTIEDGFGVATYRSCDRRLDAVCPEVMSFKLAQPASPNDALFESDTFRQLSTTITTPTQIQPELCRGSVGSHVGITLPNSSSELIENSVDNSWTTQGDEFEISTASLSMSLPVPSQRVNRYQALTPDMIQVAITMLTEVTEGAQDQAALSDCLTQGVWVGSQALEFWTEDDAEGNSVPHALSMIEIDCIDNRDGYTVVRACTHGIQ